MHANLDILVYTPFPAHASLLYVDTQCLYAIWLNI